MADALTADAELPGHFGLRMAGSQHFADLFPSPRIGHGHGGKRGRLSFRKCVASVPGFLVNVQSKHYRPGMARRKIHGYDAVSEFRRRRCRLHPANAGNRQAAFPPLHFSAGFQAETHPAPGFDAGRQGDIQLTGAGAHYHQLLDDIRPRIGLFAGSATATAGSATPAAIATPAAAIAAPAVIAAGVIRKAAVSFSIVILVAVVVNGSYRVRLRTGYDSARVQLLVARQVRVKVREQLRQFRQIADVGGVLFPHRLVDDVPNLGAGAVQLFPNQRLLSLSLSLSANALR